MVGILYTTLDMLILSLKEKTNWQETAILRGGFSILGGWITAATILNISFLLKSVGFTGGGYEEAYAFLVLLVGSGIYLTFSFRQRDPLFGLVYVWVLYGIMQGQP